jgi:chaperonin GroEL
MALFQTGKPKSAAKEMVPGSEKLQEIVVSTLNHMSLMVGATLGPGGRPVLIERPEMNMKPIVTKDGVTVIKSLGYHDSLKQLVLESARDASIRTASEAGDGTTTSTILAAAIAENTRKYLQSSEGSKQSPQKIVREMQKILPDILNKIDSYAMKVNHDCYSEFIYNVALLSANGDEDLAKSVAEAFDIVGEDGNLTIIEASGVSEYKIDKINGYAIETGYEESCKNMAQAFINDRSGTQVVLDRPVAILFDGVINDLNQVFDPLQKIGLFFEETKRHDRGVLLVAHGFSDAVIADLNYNWNSPHTSAKVYPVLTPKNAIANGQTQFLYDLQAYAGTSVFNPLDRPLSELNPEVLVSLNKIKKFEANRFRSTIIAEEDFDAIKERVEALKTIVPESEYEANDLKVRIGKLTSGIARLTIYAPSAGESREKRDRAEDAWMAVRGAVKYGALPGGGWTLVQVARYLSDLSNSEPTQGPKKMAIDILKDSVIRPVRQLYENYGYRPEEIDEFMAQLEVRFNETFDIENQKWVSKFQLLDSYPAVTEALRNSISIASLLGTLGGIVCFQRDVIEDRKEADFVRRFEGASGIRGSLAE